MSSAMDIKQGCRLCTHAFKFMHRRKRTLITKRKSRGLDSAGMHKRPENGMWLPMGRQLEMVMYIFPPRHKEKKKMVE